MRTALLGFLLVGCAVEHPTEREQPLARVDLRTAIGPADVMPVGVAIAPDGQRFVMDEQWGFYRLDGDRAFEVIPMAQMPVPDKPMQLPITDVVALGPNQFAFTAIGDGYILDTSAMTIRQHFCYLPGDDGTGPRLITQRTDALAFDAVRQTLYAQPVTFDAAGELQFAQVATYDRASGVDTAWYDMERDLAATGMVVLPDGDVVMGQGNRLLRFDPQARTSTPLDTLERYGIESIDGLALDPVSGALVVVDKQADAMFDLEITRLAL